MDVLFFHTKQYSLTLLAMQFCASSMTTGAELPTASQYAREPNRQRLILNWKFQSRKDIFSRNGEIIPQQRYRRLLGKWCFPGPSKSKSQIIRCFTFVDQSPVINSCGNVYYCF